MTILSIFSLRIPVAIFCNYSDNEICTNSCNFLSPVIFNLLPIVLVLIVNSILIQEITSSSDSLVDSSISLRLSTNETITHYRNSIVSISKLSRRQVSKNKKPRYISIIVISIWSVVTSVLYYIFNTYYLTFSENVYEENPGNYIDEKINKIIRIQSIVSILFNSNHFINFIFYFLFYSMFRDSIFKFFRKMFRIRKTHIYD